MIKSGSAVLLPALCLDDVAQSGTKAKVLFGGAAKGSNKGVGMGSVFEYNHNLCLCVPVGGFISLQGRRGIISGSAWLSVQARVQGLF